MLYAVTDTAYRVIADYSGTNGGIDTDFTDADEAIAFAKGLKKRRVTLDHPGFMDGEISWIPVLRHHKLRSVRVVESVRHWIEHSEANEAGDWEKSRGTPSYASEFPLYPSSGWKSAHESVYLLGNVAKDVDQIARTVEVPDTEADDLIAALYAEKTYATEDGEQFEVSRVETSRVDANTTRVNVFRKVAAPSRLIPLQPVTFLDSAKAVEFADEKARYQIANFGHPHGVVVLAGVARAHEESRVIFPKGVA
jgi:hypothetical protein